MAEKVLLSKTLTDNFRLRILIIFNLKFFNKTETSNNSEEFSKLVTLQPLTFDVFVALLKINNLIIDS